MTKTILILFGLLSMGSIYATYSGIGLQSIQSEKKKSIRSTSGYTSSYSSGYSSGGWSSGK